MHLDRTQDAQGSLEVFTSPRHHRSYETIFGAAFRDAASGEVQVFLFSLLDSRRGFISPEDHVMRATAGTTTGQEDCLI